MELSNGDFAFTIARQLLVFRLRHAVLAGGVGSTHPGLAAIAAKAEKETAYHLRHAAEWLIRLGDGTAESHRRAQDAVDALWPYTGELFEPTIMRWSKPASSRPRPRCAPPGRPRSTPSSRAPRSPGPRMAGCSPAAASGGIRSISATCWPSCSTAARPIRGDMVNAADRRTRPGGRGLGGRPGDTGADHRRSRHAARRRRWPATPSRSPSRRPISAAPRRCRSRKMWWRRWPRPGSRAPGCARCCRRPGPRTGSPTREGASWRRAASPRRSVTPRGWACSARHSRPAHVAAASRPSKSPRSAHPLQGAAPLPGLPRAVRGVQVPLTPTGLHHRLRA